MAGGAASGLKAPPTSLTLFLTNLVPTSIFDAMARNEVLQIVVFSLLAGVALTRLGEKGKPLLASSNSSPIWCCRWRCL